MRKLMARLWNDQGGALISVEWVFVATILVLGVSVGLVAVRNAVNSELSEAANAFSALNQGFCFYGQKNKCDGSLVAGSCATNKGGCHSQITSDGHVNGQCIDNSPCN